MARPVRIHEGSVKVRIYQPNSEACRDAEIARPETRSVCTRGALKSNEFYGSPCTRPLHIRNATLRVGTFRALMRTPAASLCRGSIAGIRASDSPVLEKPLNCRDEGSTPLGLGGGIVPNPISSYRIARNAPDTLPDARRTNGE